MILLLFVSCNTSVKVLSAWRSEDGHKMKERNIIKDTFKNFIDLNN